MSEAVGYSLGHGAINVIGYLVAAVLTWLFNRRAKDALSFVNVFSALLGGALAVNQVWYGMILRTEYALTASTLAVIFLSWWAFLATALLMMPRLTRMPPPIAGIDKTRGIWAVWFLVIANCIYSVVAMYKNNAIGAIARAGGRDVVGALAENRVDIGVGKGSVGWYFEIWHNGYLFYIPLALYLLRLGYVRERFVWFVFAIGVVNSVSGFTRIHLLMLLVVAFVSWILLFRPSWPRIRGKVLAVLAAAISFFVFLQATIDRKSNDISRQEVGSNGRIIDQVMTYSVGPITNYQEVLRGNYYQYNPHNALYSLQPVYYFASKLYLINGQEYPIGYREYVFAPFPSNVLTYLDAFTLDFGRIGAVVGSMLMGLFVAVVYRSVKTRVSYRNLVIYALSFYGCFVAVLTNMFITQVFAIHVAVGLMVHQFISAGCVTVVNPNMIQKRRQILSQRGGMSLTPPFTGNQIER